MAKPGSPEAARISAGVDLGSLRPIPEEERATMLEAAERQLGFRCADCGEVIEQGIRFEKLDVVRSQMTGKPEVVRQRVTTCEPDDPEGGGCMAGAKLMAEGDWIMEMVQFVRVEAIVEAARERMADAAGEKG